MRNVSALLLFAAAIGVTLFTPQPAPSLSSVDYNPGPVIIQDCQPHRMTAYTNDSGRTVYVVAADLWMGLYREAYADITIVLYRISDGNEVASFRMDRYSDPGGPIQRLVNIPSPGFALAPGDGLWLDALNCHVAGAASPLHPQVTVYLQQ